MKAHKNHIRPTNKNYDKWEDWYDAIQSHWQRKTKAMHRRRQHALRRNRHSRHLEHY